MSDEQASRRPRALELVADLHRILGELQTVDLSPCTDAELAEVAAETERAIAAALAAPGVDDAAARAAAGAVMGAASSLLLAWAGENNAPDAGATGTATSTAGDAATVLSRGLLSLLGES